jgi:hypothetical protein
MTSVVRAGPHIPRPSIRRRTPGSVVWIVFIGAAMANLASLLASQLWVYPDSIDYIQLAGGIADRFDLTNELFLVRTPGYPLFLAIIFWMFGASSPSVILVAQHAMAVATAVLTAAIAWRLTSRRTTAALAGILCACSLQILAYANLVLTETPYMLTFIAAVYCLVRYHQHEERRWLVAASLLSGVGYLLRPVALYLVAVCAAAALRRAWTMRRAPHLARRRWGVVVELVSASGPVLVVAAPWMVLTMSSHHSLQAARCLDYVLYFRAATLDGLDSNQSPAVTDIHKVVEKAKRTGDLSANADYRDRATVIKAYQAVRQAGFAESSAVLGRAGRDLMVEHPASITLNTFKYAVWMLLSPDPVYRFQPGGAPGKEGKRDADAVIYDTGTYAFGDGSWEWVLRDYRHYLPLSAEPCALTPWWTALMTWFHRQVEHGPAIVRLGDSLFEAIMLLCVAGGALSLFYRDRTAWFTVAAVISLHVWVSTFLGGPQTRYAAPVKPILCLYLSLLLATVLGSLWRATRLLVRMAINRKMGGIELASGLARGPA